MCQHVLFQCVDHCANILIHCAQCVGQLTVHHTVVKDVVNAGVSAGDKTDARPDSHTPTSGRPAERSSS